MQKRGGDGAIGDLKRYLDGRTDIEMAFLFGSMGKGRATSRSDADVAVYYAREYTMDDIHRMSADIERLLDREVDLIVLNEASPQVAWAALKGVALRIGDRAFYMRYLLDVSREAEDFALFCEDLWQLRQARRLQSRVTDG